MQQPHSLLWQHPYVHLWKLCGVGQWPKGDSARQGDVTSKVVSGDCWLVSHVLVPPRHAELKLDVRRCLMPKVHSDVVHVSPQDRSICRVIWRIGGNVPAANFIRLPQLHGSSLNLTGHILYLQVRC